LSSHTQKNIRKIAYLYNLMTTQTDHKIIAAHLINMIHNKYISNDDIHYILVSVSSLLNKSLDNLYNIINTVTISTLPTPINIYTEVCKITKKNISKCFVTKLYVLYIYYNLVYDRKGVNMALENVCNSVKTNLIN